MPTDCEIGKNYEDCEYWQTNPGCDGCEFFKEKERI